jgi:hypothetical protein
VRDGKVLCPVLTRYDSPIVVTVAESDPETAAETTVEIVTETAAETTVETTDEIVPQPAKGHTEAQTDHFV